MKWRVWVFIAVGFTGNAFAQIGNSSAMTDRYGSMFSYSAKPLTWSQFYFYENTKIFSGSATRYSTSSKSVDVKDFGMQIGAQIGLVENMDLILNTNLAQTTTPGNSGTSSSATPRDIYLNLRILPLNFSQGKIRGGFMLTTRWAGAGQASIPFQLYSADKTELGAGFMMSYFARPGWEETALSLHGNIQYFNHGDGGAYIGVTDETTVRNSFNGAAIAGLAVATKNSTSLHFSTGGTYPMLISGRYLFLSGDVYGVAYLTKPPLAAYSRQNYAYLALGAKYQVKDYLGVHVGMDFRIFKNSKTATYTNPVLKVEDINFSGGADHPFWHFYLGLSVPLNPRIKVYSSKSDADLYAEQNRTQTNEVKDILYSEQEIQKRSQNFTPLKEMRRTYKEIIGGLIGVLEPKDKKPAEVIDENAEGNE